MIFFAVFFLQPAFLLTTRRIAPNLWPSLPIQRPGLATRNDYRRNSAPTQTAGAFFVPAVLFYGGCVRETFGSAGFLYLRFANLHTAATLCLAT